MTTELPKPAEWALQLAAQAWCEPTTSGIVMDEKLATVFAQILTRVAASFEADRASNAPAEGMVWQPIETAPKDGTHILACHAGRPYDDTYTFNQAPPSVVHWFGWPEDAAGFYLSVALGDQKLPFEYTHWKPLGKEPCDAKRLEAEAARYPKAEARLVCDYCGADRLKQPCGEPHRPDGCRFTGSTSAASPIAAAPAIGETQP